MGCATSKFNSEEAGPTCKFEPLLRRRVKEISRRQTNERVILVSNLSFKHLLTDDGENEQSPDNHGLVKSVSSPMEIDGGTEKSPDNHGGNSVSFPIESTGGGNGKSPDNHGHIKRVSLPIESTGGGNGKSLDNHGHIKRVSSPIETDGVVKGDNVKVLHSDYRKVERVFGDEKDHRHEEAVKDHNKFDEEDEKTDEEEEGYYEREDSLVAAPGSPSFRDYCIINGHTNMDDDASDGGRVQNNPRKENSIAHMTSRQQSVIQVGKNGRNRKGRTIGNVLSKGSQKSEKKSLEC